MYIRIVKFTIIHDNFIILNLKVKYNETFYSSDTFIIAKSPVNNYH